MPTLSSNQKGNTGYIPSLLYRTHLSSAQTKGKHMPTWKAPAPSQQRHSFRAASVEHGPEGPA